MSGFESLTLPVWLWVVAVIAFAGLVHGTLGLGFPIVATPLLALTMDMRSAVILVLIPCVAVIVASIVTGPGLRRVLGEFWVLPLAMFAGGLIGTNLFIRAPNAPYTLLLAVVTLAYLNLERFGRVEWPLIKRHPKPFGIAFAFAAGVFEGTANVAAPALIVYYMAIALPVTALVQALNICFIVGKVTQFGVMATNGGVGLAQWMATAPLAVVATGTVFAGVRIRNRVDALTYRGWLKQFLFAMALVLLAQYAWLAIG